MAPGRGPGTKRKQEMSEAVSTQKVLCVHDTAGDLQMLRGSLERAGYDVVPAKTGFEAMRILRSEVVDGVVLDYKINAEGGVALRNRISHSYPEMPLLLFSHAEEIERMPLNVFREYLQHPGPPESLMSRIVNN
jgi:DNA-binding NtrC family response regulator